MSTLDTVNKLSQNIGCVYRSGGWGTGTRFLMSMATGIGEVVKKKSLNPVDARMQKGSYRFRVPGGRHVELDGRDFGLAREICCMGIYYPLPNFIIQPGWTVLDLGANVGVFTMTAAVQGAKVYSIEAQKPFLDEYKKNAERNHVTDRVQVKWGVVHFPVAFADAESRELGPNMTLTQVLDHFQLDKVDLLKADIEGSEFAMCADDPEGLKRIHRIAMEIHPTHGKVPAMVNDLESVGFTVQLRNKAGDVVSEIVEEVGFLYAWR